MPALLCRRRPPSARPLTTHPKRRFASSVLTSRPVVPSLDAVREPDEYAEALTFPTDQDARAAYCQASKLYGEVAQRRRAVATRLGISEEIDLCPSTGSVVQAYAEPGSHPPGCR